MSPPKWNKPHAHSMGPPQLLVLPLFLIPSPLEVRTASLRPWHIYLLLCPSPGRDAPSTVHRVWSVLRSVSFFFYQPSTVVNFPICTGSLGHQCQRNYSRKSSHATLWESPPAWGTPRDTPFHTPTLHPTTDSQSRCICEAGSLTAQRLHRLLLWIDLECQRAVLNASVAVFEGCVLISRPCSRATS